MERMTQQLPVIVLLTSWALTGCGDDQKAADASTSADASTDMARIDATTVDTATIDAARADNQGATDSQPVDANADAATCGSAALAPEPRSEATGVLDAQKGRILMFGGNTLAPVECRPAYAQTAELWAFDLNCNTWERVESPRAPSKRARAAAAIDTKRNRMLVFGGRDGTDFNFEYMDDLWAFDLALDQWSPVVTTGAAQAGLTPRSTLVMVYDEDKDRLLLHGGDIGGFTPDDAFFALDLETLVWSRLPSGPSARLYHGGTVSAAPNRTKTLIIFGGAPSFQGPYLNDVWEFNMVLDTWRRLRVNPEQEPVVRFGGEVFADDRRTRILVFGGHDGTTLGNKNDVRALDLINGTWSMLREGDRLNPNPQFMGQACNFPPDFTFAEEGAPSPDRRYSIVHTQSESSAFIIGGKTDCGNTNDVWELALQTGEWTQRRPATGGETCVHSGALNCTTLCF